MAAHHWAIRQCDQQDWKLLEAQIGSAAAEY
jgi:hypothetical protein